MRLRKPGIACSRYARYSSFNWASRCKHAFEVCRMEQRSELGETYIYSAEFRRYLISPVVPFDSKATTIDTEGSHSSQLFLTEH